MTPEKACKPGPQTDTEPPLNPQRFARRILRPSTQPITPAQNPAPPVSRFLLKRLLPAFYLPAFTYQALSGYPPIIHRGYPPTAEAA